jgi:hypothetical protein
MIFPSRTGNASSPPMRWTSIGCTAELTNAPIGAEVNPDVASLLRATLAIVRRTESVTPASREE